MTEFFKYAYHAIFHDAFEYSEYFKVLVTAFYFMLWDTPWLKMIPKTDETLQVSWTLGFMEKSNEYDIAQTFKLPTYVYL